MRWRGLPGKRWAPIREGITTTASSGWGTSNGNPCPGAPGYHPRVSDPSTRSSLRAGPSRRWLGAAAALAGVSLAGAIAQGAFRAAKDPLRPAAWIGLHRAAAAALPAEVAFSKAFELPAAMPHPVLEAEGDREWEIELDGRGVAGGTGPGPLRISLPGPLPPGAHRLVAVARHPFGVASIRLRLRDASGEGTGVVTGRGWVADDDASRIRDRGLGGGGGGRYRAMVWGRPPLSSWTASSVRRSLTWNGGSSSAVESSRIPSRAEAQ